MRVRVVSSALSGSVGRRGAAALAGLALVLALHAAAAGAVVLPATTIDGPSEEIVGFGGVAMAEDGTGGVVYLKREHGVPHVFVSQYLDGRWHTPIRVDRCITTPSPREQEEQENGGHCTEPFAASWPRIGAADGGELIVVWATPFAVRNEKPVYQLLGSELGPGSTRFSPATIVDRNIEEASGTSPDLAVSSTGQADVVYRVVKTENVGAVPLLRPGDVVEDVRVAHFDGQRWANLGAINRDPGVSMRPPSEANAPKIAIGPTGNGIVVWQEPDIEGVARIWARRIFGTALDYVMPVSATSFNGSPIAQDAEAPAVAFSRLGQAEVAYRQPVGPGSPLPGPRIFWNVLSDGESTSGQEFQGASVVDSEVSGGAGATVGVPSIDIDEQRDMRLLYDSNGAPRLIEGNGQGLTGALTLGPPFAGGEPIAAAALNPQGGGVAAWPSATQGAPAVAVLETFPGGAAQTALVSGGDGGEVGELAVGRSDLGDGLVAWRQGPFGNAAIVAAEASAPPAPFVVTLPKGWIKPSQALLSWLPAKSADGPLSYSIVLDGHVQASLAGALEGRVDTRGVSSGRHRVQVLATDRDGASTLSAASTLEIDGVPPSVKIVRTHGDSAVSVRVSDGYSGVDAAAVSVSFGDGSSAHGRARCVHRYAHAGVYRITVKVRDKIGNQGTVHQLVSVR
jgi:PKD domain